MHYHKGEVTRLLERVYDANYDIAPNAPKVTHSDYVALDAIRDLIEEVEELREELALLKRGMNDE